MSFDSFISLLSIYYFPGHTCLRSLIWKILNLKRMIGQQERKNKPAQQLHTWTHWLFPWAETWIVGARERKKYNLSQMVGRTDVFSTLLTHSLTGGQAALGLGPSGPKWRLVARASCRLRGHRPTETPGRAVLSLGDKYPWANSRVTWEWIKCSLRVCLNWFLLNRSQENFSVVWSHRWVPYPENMSRRVALLLEHFPFMINTFHRSGCFYLGDFTQGEDFYSYQLLLCVYIKRDVCESIKSTLDLVW